MPTLIPSLVHLSLQSSWGIDQVKALIKLSIDLSIKLSHQSSLFVNQVESLINLSCQLSWVANQAELSIELSFQSSWVVNWVESSIKLTLLYMGGCHIAPPPWAKSASGIAFWGTPIGWQFLFTLIFESSLCFMAKNDLEKVFWCQNDM